MSVKRGKKKKVINVVIYIIHKGLNNKKIVRSSKNTVKFYKRNYLVYGKNTIQTKKYEEGVTRIKGRSGVVEQMGDTKSLEILKIHILLEQKEPRGIFTSFLLP